MLPMRANNCKPDQSFDAAASEMYSINQFKKWLGGWCVGLFGGEVGVKSAVVRFR